MAFFLCGLIALFQPDPDRGSFSSCKNSNDTTVGCSECRAGMSVDPVCPVWDHWLEIPILPYQTWWHWTSAAFFHIVNSWSTAGPTCSGEAVRFYSGNMPQCSVRKAPLQQKWHDLPKAPFSLTSIHLTASICIELQISKDNWFAIDETLPFAQCAW